MTLERLSEELNTSILELNIVLERLNEQYYLITEKYGSEYAELLLEGFWDTVKKGASWLGSKVGKTVGGVEKGASWLLKKGQEFGEKVKGIVNNISGSIEKFINQAVQFIVSAPSKFMEFCKSMWAELKKSLGELKQAASDKINDIINSIVSSITTKIIEPIKNKWEEIKKNYGKMKESFIKEEAQLKDMANNFVKSGKKNLVTIGNAILKGGETAGLIVLGLIYLPFWGVYKGTEFLYSVGEGVANSIATNAPEVWKAFTTSLQQARTEVKESRILDFDSFAKRI